LLQRRRLWVDGLYAARPLAKCRKGVRRREAALRRREAALRVRVFTRLSRHSGCIHWRAEGGGREDEREAFKGGASRFVWCLLFVLIRQGEVGGALLNAGLERWEKRPATPGKETSIAGLERRTSVESFRVQG